jgi:hypothetical protein
MDGALFFAFSPTGRPKPVPLSEVVETDRTLHYSLVRTKLGGLDTLQPFSSRAPAQGERVAVIGAAMDSEDVIVNETNCVVLSLSASEFTHNCKVPPGGSGGGMVIALQDLAVLGLQNSQAIVRGERSNTAIRFDVLLKQSRALVGRSP